MQHRRHWAAASSASYYLPTTNHSSDGRAARSAAGDDPSDRIKLLVTTPLLLEGRRYDGQLREYTQDDETALWINHTVKTPARCKYLHCLLSLYVLLLACRQRRRVADGRKMKCQKLVVSFDRRPCFPCCWMCWPFDQVATVVQEKAQSSDRFLAPSQGQNELDST